MKKILSFVSVACLLGSVSNPGCLASEIEEDLGRASSASTFNLMEVNLDDMAVLPDEEIDRQIVKWEKIQRLAALKNGIQWQSSEFDGKKESLKYEISKKRFELEEMKRSAILNEEFQRAERRTALVKAQAEIVTSFQRSNAEVRLLHVEEQQKIVELSKQKYQAEKGVLGRAWGLVAGTNVPVEVGLNPHLETAEREKQQVLSALASIEAQVNPPRTQLLSPHRESTLVEEVEY